MNIIFYIILLLLFYFITNTEHFDPLNETTHTKYEFLPSASLMAGLSPSVLPQNVKNSDETLSFSSKEKDNITNTITNCCLVEKKYVSNKKYLSNFFNNHFKELFKEIISISEINKFNLNYIFNELKDSKRTLLFGEIANKIHPIAGQGWNMTLRNIFSLIKVIKYSMNLGLEIGNDIFIKKYLNETNLNSLAFATLIDGIRKIFDIKIDSYAATRKNILSNLDKNFFIKKNFINIANKGLFI